MLTTKIRRPSDERKKISWFSIDYDKISHEDMISECSWLYDALLMNNQRHPRIMVYLTGTKNHRSVVVENVNISFQDSVKIVEASKCTREYLALVIVTASFWSRDSKRITADKKNGRTITPAYKLEMVCEDGVLKA